MDIDIHRSGRGAYLLPCPRVSSNVSTGHRSAPDIALSLESVAKLLNQEGDKVLILESQNNHYLNLKAEQLRKEGIEVELGDKLDLCKYITHKNNAKKDNNSFIDQIKKLNDLYKSGILSKEEFEKAKKRILNN